MTSTALANEVEQLKAAALGYEARHLPIATFILPPGVRMAVNFTLDFDAMLARRLANEPPMQLASRSSAAASAFGACWKCTKLMTSRSRCSPRGGSVNSIRRPSSGRPEPGTKSPITCGSITFPSDKALEEDHLLKTIAALERVAGRRPVGTRSEHSPELLRREGSHLLILRPRAPTHHSIRTTRTA